MNVVQMSSKLLTETLATSIGKNFERDTLTFCALLMEISTVFSYDRV